MAGERFFTIAEPLPSLRVLERQPVGDERGTLERLYDADGLDGVLEVTRVAQVNRTLTAARGTLRGMHFQREPYAEIKIVHCVRGAVFDVAIDVRPESATFLRWHGEVLSAQNKRFLRIPEGFAHGFQTLEDDCEMIYVHSQPYRPDFEAGIHPCDPALGIAWPIEIMLLSDRDTGHPPINDRFIGVSP